MKQQCSLNLSLATVVFAAGSQLALAGALGEPIPGYTFRDGAYQPDEPYREGQPRVTGLQQPWPQMKSVQENPITPAKAATWSDAGPMPRNTARPMTEAKTQATAPVRGLMASPSVP